MYIYKSLIPQKYYLNIRLFLCDYIQNQHVATYTQQNHTHLKLPWGLNKHVIVYIQKISPCQHKHSTKHKTHKQHLAGQDRHNCSYYHTIENPQSLVP